MYSNDYTQVKAGLINYIGSLLNACPFEGEKASRQYVVATLIEEAMNLMKNEKDEIDMFVAKPLLRGVKVTLNNRSKELEKLPNVKQVKDQIEAYNNCCLFLDSLINSIKE